MNENLHSFWWKFGILEVGWKFRAGSVGRGSAARANKSNMTCYTIIIVQTCNGSTARQQKSRTTHRNDPAVMRLFDIFCKVWYTRFREHTWNGRRSSLFLIFAPTAHWNRWEVIALDSFVTFRDLLEIGTFLISLATFIVSLCKKHDNRDHKKKKK